MVGRKLITTLAERDVEVEREREREEKREGAKGGGLRKWVWSDSCFSRAAAAMRARHGRSGSCTFKSRISFKKKMPGRYLS